MLFKKLSELAKIDISNVDKKTKTGEQEVKLCNFVDVYHKWALKDSMVDGLMSATANENQISRFKLHSGQVAITKDSETKDDIGMAMLVDINMPDVVLGYHCALIIPDGNKLSASYLNVVLHSSYASKYFEMNASGSGQRYTLTNDIIGNFPVPMISLKEQESISDVFDQINNKILTNNAIISELEAMAKDIYDYWFVQFDFPDENGKPYKSSGGKMVWNEELKREIPEGWMKGCISSIATLINDQVSPEDNEIYIHYSIPAFDSGRIPVREQGSTIESNKYVVSKEMILASKLNPQFPRIWWPAFIEVNMICSTEFLPLIPNNELYRVFLYLLLKSDALCTEMKQKATCSTGSRRRIDPDVFMSMCFALPTNKTIIAFSEKVFPIIEKVNVCLKENEELTSLRDFLLPLLMNGQVKIGDMEA